MRPRPTRSYSAWPWPPTSSATPSRPRRPSSKRAAPRRSRMGLAYTVKIIAEVDRGENEPVLAEPAAGRRGSPEGRRGRARPVRTADRRTRRDLRRIQSAADPGRPVRGCRSKALGILLEAHQSPRPQGVPHRPPATARGRRQARSGDPGNGPGRQAIRPGGFKGKKAVLVVFWASWCLPCEAEVESLHAVEEAYRGRGLQIVGINLDPLSATDPKSRSALPNVRRFLLDNNVTWPTLVNGQGDKRLRRGLRRGRDPRERPRGPGWDRRADRPGAQEPRADDRPRDRPLKKRGPSPTGTRSATASRRAMRVAAAAPEGCDRRLRCQPGGAG